MQCGLPEVQDDKDACLSASSPAADVPGRWGRWSYRHRGDRTSGRLSTTLRAEAHNVQGEPSRPLCSMCQDECSEATRHPLTGPTPPPAPLYSSWASCSSRAAAASTLASASGLGSARIRTYAGLRPRICNQEGGTYCQHRHHDTCSHRNGSKPTSMRTPNWVAR